jgi:hypothetical protein
MHERDLNPKEVEINVKRGVIRTKVVARGKGEVKFMELLGQRGEIPRCVGEYTEGEGQHGTEWVEEHKRQTANRDGTQNLHVADELDQWENVSESRKVPLGDFLPDRRHDSDDKGIDDDVFSLLESEQGHGRRFWNKADVMAGRFVLTRLRLKGSTAGSTPTACVRCPGCAFVMSVNCLLWLRVIVCTGDCFAVNGDGDGILRWGRWVADRNLHQLVERSRVHHVGVETGGIELGELGIQVVGHPWPEGGGIRVIRGKTRKVGAI